MDYGKLKYLALLILTCLFLTGQASASSDCEEVMTCCDTAPVQSSIQQDCEPVNSMCCRDACDCSLNSSRPIQPSRDMIFATVRVDFQVQDFCLVVLPKEKTLAQDKPIWPPQDDISWESFILPLCSFPNPPPAAA